MKIDGRFNERVIQYLLNEESAVVNGRNFSLVHDAWGSTELREDLLANSDLYKLRRNQALSSCSKSDAKL
ncbi:MAG: hypothetical protein S4CHLAM81_02710 [Chlamydiales bacterium]|nr:hypothetical protein [Chlamydiales bacterium]MCH9635062.1 hypothetical protein [Chlamydiales bacterium]MCH9704202.1 hypothetical protein [Chlamydiota bacterium]